jgi:hypothetical protein
VAQQQGFHTGRTAEVLIPEILRGAEWPSSIDL